MKKLFLGIAPDHESLDWFEARLAELRDQVQHQALRWTKAQKVHLTLGFMGHVPDSEVDNLAERARRIAPAHRPFSLELCDLQGFPHLVRPKTVWVGCQESPELTQLQRDLASVLPFDAKPFVPHFTLGRVSPGSPAVGRLVESYRQGCPDLQCTLPVMRYHLYESLPSGEYSVLATFPLGVAADPSN